MHQTWAKIESWLAANHPLFSPKCKFNPPATPAAIRLAESELGLTFPADFTSSLQIHDGQSNFWEFCWLPNGTGLLSLTDILTKWRQEIAIYQSQPDIEDFITDYQDNDQISNVVFHPKRIPIANDDGDSYLYLDFVPGPKGQSGQIITNQTECDFIVLAPNFSTFLTKYLHLLETGVFKYVDNYGLTSPKMLELQKTNDPSFWTYYQTVFKNDTDDPKAIFLEKFNLLKPQVDKLRDQKILGPSTLNLCDQLFQLLEDNKSLYTNDDKRVYDAFFYLSNLYNWMDILDKALFCADKCLEMDPHFFTGYIIKAEVLKKQNKLLEIIGLYTQGLDKVDEPERQASLLNNRCYAYLQLNDKPKVLEDASKLMDLLNSLEPYESLQGKYLTLLEAFDYLGDMEKYYQALPRVLKIFKDNLDEMFAEPYVKKHFEESKFKEILSKMNDFIPPNFPSSLLSLQSKLATTEKDYIALRLTLGQDLTPVCSKVGGSNFYFPQSMAYPLDDHDVPLLFLAQINWSEVPPLTGYPQSGLLQFFIGTDDLMGLNIKDDLRSQINFRVIYHPNTNQSQKDLTEIFTKLNSMNVYGPVQDNKKEYKMNFSKLKMPISPVDYRFKKLFKDIENKLWDDYADYCWKLDDGHRIGGYPMFTQDDPREYKNIPDYELLFQLGSDSYICWGDCGVGNFFIHPDDLAKLDFSKVAYTWDCS